MLCLPNSVALFCFFRDNSEVCEFTFVLCTCFRFCFVADELGVDANPCRPVGTPLLPERRCGRTIALLHAVERQDCVRVVLLLDPAKRLAVTSEERKGSPEQVTAGKKMSCKTFSTARLCKVVLFNQRKGRCTRWRVVLAAF